MPLKTKIILRPLDEELLKAEYRIRCPGAPMHARRPYGHETAATSNDPIYNFLKGVLEACNEEKYVND